jgi:hypothetical protein
MKQTLEWRNGWLTVRLSQSLSEEPIMVHSYYPIARMSEFDAFQTHHGNMGGTVYQRADGMYFITRPHGIILFSLRDGGKTLPVATDQEPIKRPRGKDVRWEYGDWVKYTKSGRQVVYSGESH